MPLQEFAPATTSIPIEIPIENLYWNSHGCRSKLLQRLSIINSSAYQPINLSTYQPINL